ncbi:MAG TPA: hypothetical protein VGE85_17540 [Terracidiphilus sp.]|jgi:hypothetical protein
MKISYTITLDDFKAAQRLSIRQKLSRRIISVLLNIVVPILAVLGLAVDPYLHLTDRTPNSVLIVITGIQLLLIYLSFAVPISRYLQTRKAFKRIYPPTRIDRNFSIDIDDERILSAMPGYAEITFLWTAIVAFAQDEKATLFYLDNSGFLFFPTHTLSPDQRTELNDLVARNLVRKQK